MRRMMSIVALAVMMSIVALAVLSTVNAPYGTNLSAEQSAAKIADTKSADRYGPAAFSFFPEVAEDLQHSFLDEMNVDPNAAFMVAQKFADMAGYEMPLTRAA